MGRIANIKRSARVGYGTSRMYRADGINKLINKMPTEALEMFGGPTHIDNPMTKGFNAAGVEGFDLRLNQAASQAGRAAGAAHNFAQVHPYMTTAAGVGLSALALHDMFGGNSTDAADSAINPGPRSPNVNMGAANLDGKLKQRTLQRLQDNINLNRIYIDALGGAV